MIKSDIAYLLHSKKFSKNISKWSRAESLDDICYESEQAKKRASLSCDSLTYSSQKPQMITNVQVSNDISTGYTKQWCWCYYLNENDSLRFCVRDQQL